jgi:hypothetical protein
MPDEAGFGRRTDGLTGRRRAARERMSLPVSLYSIDQSRVALLADLSQSGCRLQGTALPEVGKDVLLKAADVELFGRIVWKDARERGVKFDEAINDTDMENLRQALARQRGQESAHSDVIPPEGRRKTRS